VDEEAEDEIAVLVGSFGVEGGEWQDDKAHEELDCGTEDEAADQRIGFEEWEWAAGGVVNGSGRAGDEEVEQDTE
jgi:hypothetical protein